MSDLVNKIRKDIERDREEKERLNRAFSQNLPILEKLKEKVKNHVDYINNNVGTKIFLFYEGSSIDDPSGKEHGRFGVKSTRFSPGGSRSKLFDPDAYHGGGVDVFTSGITGEIIMEVYPCDIFIKNISCIKHIESSTYSVDPSRITEEHLENILNCIY